MATPAEGLARRPHRRRRRRPRAPQPRRPAALLARAPDDYTESFDRAADAGLIDRELAKALRPSVGLRNVLVHAYLDVDRDIVAAAVPLAIEQYGAYVRQAATFARDRAT